MRIVRATTKAAAHPSVDSKNRDCNDKETVSCISLTFSCKQDFPCVLLMTLKQDQSTKHNGKPLLMHEIDPPPPFSAQGREALLCTKDPSHSPVSSRILLEYTVRIQTRVLPIPNMIRNSMNNYESRVGTQQEHLQDFQLPCKNVSCHRHLIKSNSPQSQSLVNQGRRCIAN